jgi:hypothetical protein
MSVPAMPTGRSRRRAFRSARALLDRPRCRSGSSASVGDQLPARALWVARRPGERPSVSWPDLAVADDVFGSSSRVRGTRRLVDRIDYATEARRPAHCQAAESIPGVREQIRSSPGSSASHSYRLVAALFRLRSSSALLSTRGALSPDDCLGRHAVQSVTVALAACVLGSLASLALVEVIPASIPVDLRNGRFLVNAALVARPPLAFCPLRRSSAHPASALN